MFADPQTESAIAGLAFDGALRSLLIAAYAGLLVCAAVYDLRRFIIPDSITVALLGLWPFWVVLNGTVSLGPIVLGAVVLFGVGLALFALGVMGGGDVKLMSVLALWAGPAGLPAFLFYTSVAGGLLSLYWIMPLRRLVAPVIGWTAGQHNNKRIPYGVAIAVGGLAVAQRFWLG